MKIIITTCLDQREEWLEQEEAVTAVRRQEDGPRHSGGEGNSQRCSDG
jgi:hypothetical protein